MADPDHEQRMQAIRDTLASLRWSVDMIVMTPFGELVVLGPSYNAHGVRTGITDCCSVFTPCGRHRELCAAYALEPAHMNLIRVKCLNAPGGDFWHEVADGWPAPCAMTLQHPVTGAWGHYDVIAPGRASYQYRGPASAPAT